MPFMTDLRHIYLSTNVICLDVWVLYVMPHRHELASLKSMKHRSRPSVFWSYKSYNILFVDGCPFHT